MIFFSASVGDLKRSCAQIAADSDCAQWLIFHSEETIYLSIWLPKERAIILETGISLGDYD